VYVIGTIRRKVRSYREFSCLSSLRVGKGKEEKVHARAARAVPLTIITVGKSNSAGSEQMAGIFVSLPMITSFSSPANCIWHCQSKSQRGINFQCRTCAMKLLITRPMLIGEWLEKLQRYTKVVEFVIRPNPKNSTEPDVAVQAEGERILKSLNAQVGPLRLPRRIHFGSVKFQVV
jgi:hypothetical protein